MSLGFYYNRNDKIEQQQQQQQNFESDMNKIKKKNYMQILINNHGTIEYIK